ncbi:MAG: hypothetical protein WCP86_08340, partial [bacterium]
MLRQQLAALSHGAVGIQRPTFGIRGCWGAHGRIPYSVVGRVIPNAPRLQVQNKAGVLSRASFTIIELMAASAILLIVVTLALYGFMYAMKENARSMVQNELDMDVQGSMELLKRDLRLSALNKMFFFPLGSGSYSAVSFPIAYPNTNWGTVELDTNGKIVWDETVIFHVWKTSPNQLRCTRFKPRTILSDADMQAQLTYVATNGCATNK